MKKIFLLSTISVLGTVANAQFTVKVESPADYSAKEAYIYTLDGSKDILYSKQNKVGNTWDFKVSEPYSGMMKIYFPETNSAVSFVSENKNVGIGLKVNNDKVSSVVFSDQPNIILNDFIDSQQKREFVLPALYQLKDYYNQSTDFGKALEKEIDRLSAGEKNTESYPFVKFYIDSYNKFLVKDPSKKSPTEAEIRTFLSKTNDRLETSNLLRPILISYLNSGPSTNVPQAVDQLLAAVDIESPRGQTFLSEFIEIFDAYGMDDLKVKYLDKAKGLTCTISNRLSSTITSNEHTKIGAQFPNTTFVSAINTKAKSVYDVKATHKIVMFWASTCSHCEKQLPELIAKYQQLKSLGVEIIGLSLDSEKAAYHNRVKDLPWVNDSELKGWYSSYEATYNVHATPSYFILDSKNKILAKPNNAKEVINYFKLK